VQRLRILTESWPGVQRADCTVAEIVESARGRIRQSDAVEYTYLARTGEAVVEGLIVEPVIVALTELLDNAAAYSGEAVSVYVQPVPTGMRITVEDRGLGMSPAQSAEAEAALASGATDVTGLAEPGKLGFLVIGRLARTYGLRVGLSPSASGGVRADLLVPAAHLVADEEPGEDVPLMASEPAPLRRRVPATAPQPLPPLPAPGAGREPATDPEPVSASAVAVREAAGHPVGPGTRGFPEMPAAPEAPAHPPAAASVSAEPADGAPAGGPELTAHGLPRRQPRKAVRRTGAPRQQEVTDHEAFAEGFAQLRGVLAAGYGDHTIDEG
jgi:hypothetical protein